MQYNSSRQLLFTFDFKGPERILAGKKYNINFTVKNLEDKTFHLSSIVVRRSAKRGFPLIPLNWDNRDHGTPSDPNWWFHYYHLGDLFAKKEITKKIALDVSPKARQKSYKIYLLLGGYTDSNFKTWVTTRWASHRMILINKKSLKRSFTTTAALTPPNVSPIRLLPNKESFPPGWSLWFLQNEPPPLPPIRYKGYVNGVTGIYHSKKREKRIFVNIRKFKSTRQARRKLDNLYNLWWDEHRLPGELSEMILNGHPVTRFVRENGVIYGWQNKNFVFCIYTLGSKSDELYVKKFVKGIRY